MVRTKTPDAWCAPATPVLRSQTGHLKSSIAPTSRRSSTTVFGRLRAIDAVARDIMLRIGEQMIADPGERQIGDHVVLFVEMSNRFPLRAEMTMLSNDSITPFGRPVVPDV